MESNKRRKFIKTSGLASAGLLFLPACGSSSENRKQLQQQDKETEIGIQIYTLRDLLAEDPADVIKKIATIGYDYLEIYGYADGEYFGMSAGAFYKLVKDSGLKIKSSHHHTGRIGKKRGTMLNGWEQAVEDADKAGQEYMVCAWLDPEERKSLDDYKELTDILNRAGEISREAGIQLCYHNHDFEFMEMEGEIPMNYLLENTDEKYLKTELDLYWITKAGFDPVEFFEKFPGRIPLWHVKDMEDSPEKGFDEVGEGIIDFQRIFANAERSGMKYFFVEQDISEDPLASVKISYNNLKTNIL